ncbi:MAG: dTMP kinase [Acidobacteria bacterium]|nr:dTMP kinase [Acidobacteriaceae bacterium]MBV9610145.1 dTMP kinase [Acidobacteriota bacterium]
MGYDSPVRRRGKFITIEGLDGCGKSTQLEKLAGVLRAEGLDVLTTREPGGTPIGEKIRAVLLDSHTSGLSPWAELALMFAARAQHIDEVILPALNAGKFVLCDRFTDSSEAYQGGGRRLGSEPVIELHKVLCRGLQPDMTILMLSDVAASVARARRRNLSRVPTVANAGVAASDENRFEKESRAFFERVFNAYQAIAAREPERVFAIDARPAPEVVHQQIVRAVRERVLGQQFQVSSF